MMKLCHYKRCVIIGIAAQVLGCGDADDAPSVAERELLEQSPRMRSRALRYEVFVDAGSRQPELIGAGVLQITGYRCSHVDRVFKEDLVACRGRVNVSIVGEAGSTWQIGVDRPKPKSTHFFEPEKLEYSGSLLSFHLWASEERPGRDRRLDIACFIHGELPGEGETVEEARCLSGGRASRRVGDVWLSLYGEDADSDERVTRRLNSPD